MEAGGYPAWSGDGVPWNRRGGEQAAIAIQTGIAGLPLPPALGRTHVRRLEDFETLTGRPAPRLAEWLAARRVACPDRPTPLSGRIPDAAGSTCPGTSGEAAAMPWTGQPAHDSTTLSPMAAEPRWWEVRSARNPSGAFYRCPFCDGPVHAATEHLLVVPEGDAARRRHAHTECAREARERGELPLREDVRPEGGFLRRWFRRRG
ncbi:MAG: hypothetical protein GWM90_19765 [Gemmatimonadetes bacterium]|nr:hypothetical protein [Gemmatimonadota bacterium]NIR38825.1 hypothetical protein [Actinomycetota bacterium]NIU76853.1 hypothetical protein [Gammaproteobacteria bacterium]NIQ56666.1 hypothetical protein [Gemmatimonadota bacterium]NIX22592.1 hypothetical protein [Actinomycetota bacterium]